MTWSRVSLDSGCVAFAAMAVLLPAGKAGWAQPATTTELKSEIIEYYMMYRRSPSRKWYEDMRTKGDPYPAAAEILRDNEPRADQGESAWRTTIALNLMRFMIEDGDTRPYDVMLPYLDSPQIESRWMTVANCVITLQHAGGEARIRKVLESPAEGDRQRYLKANALDSIMRWGGAHWLPCLRQMKLAPDEKDTVVESTLKSAIEALEKKYPKQPDAHMPPTTPGSGSSAGHPPETPVPPAVPEAAIPSPHPPADKGNEPKTDAHSARRTIGLGIAASAAILIVALGLLWKSRRGISGGS